jgi:hypothetical protein
MPVKAIPQWKRGDRVQWTGAGLGTRITRTGKVIRSRWMAKTIEVKGDDGKKYHPYASWLTLVGDQPPVK